MPRSPWIACSRIGAPLAPGAVSTAEWLGHPCGEEGRRGQASDVREEEGGRLREHQAGHDALLSFSSSFSERTALTGAERRVSDFRERWVERVGGMAKLRRRQSGREGAPFKLKGRSGEVITATSSASADATQIQRLRTFRSAIVPRAPARRQRSNHKDAKPFVNAHDGPRNHWS